MTLCALVVTTPNLNCSTILLGSKYPSPLNDKQQVLGSEKNQAKV